MEYFYAPFEIKSDNTSDGTIRGYGSTFNNIDSYGDSVARGAFSKSLAAIRFGAVAYPPMLLQHDSDQNPIGIWTSMDEDDKGLRLEGKLAIKTQRGADAYALLKMKPRSAIDGLSIGYRAKNYTIHKSGPIKRTLTEVSLVECSLVTFPADQFARVASVKRWIDTDPEADAMTMKELAWMQFLELRRLMNHTPR